jgi:hypothetical protein
MIIEITPAKAFIIAAICGYLWWIWAVNGKA